MQKLSDNDIDKIFKHAADQQRPKFDAADWDDLASRLDKQSQPRPGYYTWTGVVVVLGVLIWLSFTVSNTLESADAGLSRTSTIPNNAAIQVVVPDEKSETGITSKSNKDFSAQELNDAELNQSVSIEKYKPSAKADAEVRVKKSLAVSRDAPLKQSMISSRDRRATANQSRRALQVSPKEVDEFSRERKDKVAALDGNKDAVKGNELNVSASAPATLNVVDKNVVPLADTRPEDDGTSSTRVSQSSGAKNTSVMETVAVDSAVVPGIEKKKKKRLTVTSESDSVGKKSTFYRLGIRATASPDFSAEQFGSVDKTGVNYGVIMEYFMSRNVSVSTGAIWSRKFYSAEDVEYSIYQASHVQGDCRMWDIPLNVNFYFNPEKAYSFFASAGLTSYLMNEENYVFEVQTGYGTHTYAQQVNKENNEWFKTLNLSVGLQKQFNPRIAIQIEPFVKVPLAGVGAGNISLSSFGSFLSIRYNFLTSQK